jgi:hypothetical protein
MNTREVIVNEKDMPQKQASKDSGVSKVVDEDVIQNIDQVSLGHMLSHIFEKALNI